MSWKFVYLGERDFVEAISYREAFKIAMGRNISPDTLFIFKSDKAGVFGGDYTNIKTTFCKERGIPIARQILSRNANYFDNRIFVAQAFYHSPVKTTVSEWTERVARILRRLGLEALPDRNDVIIKGKKVSSIGVFSFEETLQWSSFNINMSFNYELAEEAIVPKHNLRETVTGINDVSERKIFDDEVVLAIKEELEEWLQEKVDVFYELTEAEMEIVAGLREKYASEQWIKQKRWSPVKDYGRQ